MKRLLWASALVMFLGVAAVLLNSSREKTGIPARALDPELRAPPQVAATIARACANCHSKATLWPWYSKLPIIGSGLASDVTQARSALDFSEWSARERDTGSSADFMLTVACADIRTHRMPLPNYLWLHPEARLTDQEIRRFCSWAQQRAARASSN